MVRPKTYVIPLINTVISYIDMIKLLKGVFSSCTDNTENANFNEVFFICEVYMVYLTGFCLLMLTG